MARNISINNFDNFLLIKSEDESNNIDHVPAMVYRAAISPHGLILIKDRKNFKMPQMRFGKHTQYRNIITAGYSKEGNSLGVLLYGHKGSGKSLLAEELGNWMLTQDLPVIMITEAMDSDQLRIIINSVGPCMVYFDEYGKMYDDEDRRARLLPLFSDTSFDGVLFVVTGNETSEFGEFLVNRPQRFRYAIHHPRGIGKETMQDMLNKMQVAEHLHRSFMAYAVKASDLNFDSALAVIRATAGVTDVDTIPEMCEIMNVPDFPNRAPVISGVTVLQDSEDMCVGYEAELRRGQLDIVEYSLSATRRKLRNRVILAFKELPQDEHGAGTYLYEGKHFHLQIDFKRDYSVLAEDFAQLPTAEDDPEEEAAFGDSGGEDNSKPVTGWKDLRPADTGLEVMGSDQSFGGGERRGQIRPITSHTVYDAASGNSRPRTF